MAATQQFRGKVDGNALPAKPLVLTVPPSLIAHFRVGRRKG
jgi:hypothetical protein